jgi:hypothetical protein
MRKITSLILALAFIMVAVTGIQLDLSHGGGKESKPAHTQSNAATISHAVSAAHDFHQPSFYPKVIHEWFGYLFIVAGCVHLILNLKAMQSYLRIKK